MCLGLDSIVVPWTEVEECRGMVWIDAKPRVVLTRVAVERVVAKPRFGAPWLVLG